MIAGDTGLDDSGGDFNRVPGIILSALVVAAGYFVLANLRTGAIATAGAAAAALGVPPLMFFLTFDQNGFPPYSTEGILYVSAGVWLASYFVGPSRGRPFFLGAGLIGLWLAVLQATENVFDAPFLLMGGFFGASRWPSTAPVPAATSEAGTSAAASGAARSTSRTPPPSVRCPSVLGWPFSWSDAGSIAAAAPGPAPPSRWPLCRASWWASWASRPTSSRPGPGCSWC